MLKTWIFASLVTISVAGCGSGMAVNSASLDDHYSDLANAADAEVRHSDETGNTETACSIFVRNVLNRMELGIPEFVANDFHLVMEKYLPTWSVSEFRVDDPHTGREALRVFLNDAIDGSGFVAQWPRVGNNGHVAILEKVAADNYVIFQAQLGRSKPHRSAVTIEQLLYAKSETSDREKLRLFAKP